MLNITGVIRGLSNGNGHGQPGSLVLGAGEVSLGSFGIFRVAHILDEMWLQVGHCHLEVMKALRNGSVNGARGVGRSSRDSATLHRMKTAVFFEIHQAALPMHPPRVGSRVQSF